MVASVIKGVDVTEIYSPERVNRLAAKMGLVPGHLLDHERLRLHQGGGPAEGLEVAQDHVPICRCWFAPVYNV